MLERVYAADVAQVYELWIEYAAAANDGDLERWMALWVNDGIRMPPSDFGPRQVGREQIRAAVQPIFASFDSEMTIDVEEVQILGEQAYSHGAFELRLMPKEEGNTLEVKGNFLTVLAKQTDGSWKIAIDCFNCPAYQRPDQAHWRSS
jgi:uncharacterized protein (TIGR02246 family)